jgi:uncharacterized protein (DUF1330 family)
MKANHKLMLALVIGIGIGASGAGAILGQTSVPPAYFISEATIHDQDLYRKFLAEEAKAPNSQFGGRQLVRGGRVIAIEGEPTPPPRVAIVAFDSVEAARRWAESPAHVEATKLYHQAAIGRTFIVEGFVP